MHDILTKLLKPRCTIKSDTEWTIDIGVIQTKNNVYVKIQLTPVKHVIRKSYLKCVTLFQHYILAVKYNRVTSFDIIETSLKAASVYDNGIN